MNPLCPRRIRGVQEGHGDEPDHEVFWQPCHDPHDDEIECGCGLHHGKDFQHTAAVLGDQAIAAARALVMAFSHGTSALKTNGNDLRKRKDAIMNRAQSMIEMGNSKLEFRQPMP